MNEAITADEQRAKRREYRQRPDVRLRIKEYKALPENREKARQYSRRRHEETYRLRGAAWVADRISSARSNAERKGVPFDRDACRRALENAPDTCPVFGVPLQAGGPRTNYHAALDERIPGRGYVEGNLQVISDLANRIKSDATPEQVMAVALFLTNKSRLPQ